MEGPLSEGRRPILVTGSHRSGSTWVGQMIAMSPHVGYIHEPFGLHHHLGVCAMEVPYWFMYVTEENAADFRPYLEKTLSFTYSPGAELRSARKPRHLARLPIDGGHFLKYRLLRGRPLMKDPLALFSSEWLASEFDMDVVLLVRHPAAFAASIRRQRYTHPFSHFLLQPRLMERLRPFEDEIETMDATSHDVLDEAALLWRITTYMTIELRRAHPGWSFYRYEDLVDDPARRFSEMFGRFNLPFSPKIRDSVVRATDPNVSGWKARLSAQEAEVLRSRVDDLTNGLYTAEDW